MTWNWEKPDWPKFTFDSKALEAFETRFLVKSGEFLGAFKHVGQDDRDMLKIELISDEAIKTSEIEGEILRRESVQCSLRQQFGLEGDDTNVNEAEHGIAEMMADLYKRFAPPLTHDMLFEWHKMLMSGDRQIQDIGSYRTHLEPMQVVTPIAGRPKVHFVAPLSNSIGKEMDAFIIWFNDTAPERKNPLPALTRAGIAHLYFVCVHPFEDGNGRIGRAIAEKSLAENLGQPTLIALAYTIERKRRLYYEALERNNKDLEITDWLKYFALTILEAQENTINRVDFYVAKAKFYERLRGQFNERQEKVVARMFREGIDGFKGGLSAENYISITKTSRATATRDLQNLVEMGAFTKTGELRHTRYELNLPEDV
ncbi:MAG: Fic family protein [Pseudomonadota bacterium]